MKNQLDVTLQILETQELSSFEDDSTVDKCGSASADNGSTTVYACCCCCC